MQESRDLLYSVSSSIKELSQELEQDDRGLEQLGNQLARSCKLSFLPGKGVDRNKLWMIEDRLELGDYRSAVDIAEEYVEDNRYFGIF